MAVNLKKELAKNDIILVGVPNETYVKNVFGIVKQLKSFKGVCYVSLNQMADMVVEYLMKNKINVNNFHFIDTITKTVNPRPKKQKSIIFADHMCTLTNLTLMLSEKVNTKHPLLFFDSVSTLLLHRDRKTVMQFMEHLIHHVKGRGTKAVFIALKSDVKDNIVKEVEMLVDKVVIC